MNTIKIFAAKRPSYFLTLFLLDFSTKRDFCVILLLMEEISFVAQQNVALFVNNV